MRFVADENVPGYAVVLLRIAGHDVLSIAEVAPSATDESILRMASIESRILITRDKQDFGSLVYQERLPPPPAVILFRIADTGVAATSRFILDTFEARNDWEGYFWVVNERGVRSRPFPG